MILSGSLSFSHHIRSLSASSSHRPMNLFPRQKCLLPYRTFEVVRPDPLPALSPGPVAPVRWIMTSRSSEFGFVKTNQSPVNSPIRVGSAIGSQHFNVAGSTGRLVAFAVDANARILFESEQGIQRFLVDACLRELNFGLLLLRCVHNRGA
jgi:hypothetical protein